MIEVRAATDADKSGVLQLLTTVFGPRHSARLEAQWDWQWHQDPRLPQPGYRGVVAVWRDEIIGNASYLPAALHVYGKPINAWWGVDLAVNTARVREALRDERKTGPTRQRRDGASIAARLVDHPRAGYDLIGKLVSEQMQVVTRKTGFRSVPGSGYMERELSVTPRIRRYSGALLAPLLAAAPNLRLPRLPNRPSSIEIYDGRFDVRFDELWARVASDYPCIGLRDARTLQWRYGEHPIHKYTTLINQIDGRLSGYVVVKTYLRNRCLRGRIVDLLTTSGDPTAAQRLLTGACHTLRDLGARDVDCYVANDGLSKALQALHFQRGSKSVPLLIRGLKTVGVPFVLAGDGDGA